MGVEHIKIQELTMKVDMKKGRFYRYGIEFKIGVDISQIDTLTEILQLLTLRPVFVKGKAFQNEKKEEKEEEDVDLGLTIKTLEKNRSRPHLLDAETLEPMDSGGSKSSKRSQRSKSGSVDRMLKSFNRLSLSIGGKPTHLDIDM